MDTTTPGQVTENDVLAVLGGTPPSTVAARSGAQPVDLDEAVEVYRQAGRAALHEPVTSSV